ncbi:MAG: site-specific DNA-methyltransferase [Bacteroidales bacterium]|nr:site-specific DNA-methyltransferase [Candidatus Physcocola equi]
MKKQNEIDRDALAQRIRMLDGLSADDKSALLELLNQKKYGLVWENKPENVEEELRTHIPVLEEVKERFVSSDNPDAPNHILIEGDNLQALTTLAYTHEGKIDVIYIDPPYNTGNKDFVYNDSYVDSEDSYRHSKWLSFMEKRLRIARRLLSDKGVIFISIDDNEQANLKLLCDEVFGESNFVSNIIWQKKFSPQNDAKWFSDNHDFVICYSRNKNLWHPSLMKRSDANNSRYSNPDNDPRGVWASTDLAVKTYSKEYDYPINTPSGRVVYPSAGRCWMTSSERMERLILDNRIWFGKSGNNVPRLKTFLSEVQEGMVPLTLWLHSEVGHNQQGKQELKSILTEKSMLFNSPKPTKLISRILNLSGHKYSTILDFFAGSGTTLHATMQLNAEDGGHRQCILVTNNENGICENVTYERNRRVIQGYTDAKGNQVDGLTDNKLRYYKVNLVDRENSSDNRQKLMQTCTDLLCIKENIYNETAFGPKCVRPQFLRFFSNNNGDALLIIFIVDSRLVDYVNETVSALPDNGKRIKTYVYSENDYPYSDDFTPVASRLELVAMPAAMRNALRNVLPDPHKTPVLDVEENTAADGEINFNDLSQD